MERASADHADWLVGCGGTQGNAAVAEKGAACRRGTALVLALALAQGSGFAVADHKRGGAGTALVAAGQQATAEAEEQASPRIAAAAAQSIFGMLSTISTNVQDRQNSQGAGRSSGNHFAANQHVWLKPFGSQADQDDRNGVSGYEARSHGIVLGADGDLASGSRMGLAFGYAQTDVDSNASTAGQKADITSYQLIAYGGGKLAGGAMLNLQADIGRHRTEGTRNITFVSPSRVARSDYDSWSAHLGASVLKAYTVSESTRFFPSLRADYTYIRTEAYRESGADALNLNVGKNKTDAFVLGIDGAVTHAMSDRVSLSANAGVGYDVINERSSITAAYAGAPSATFSTEGIDPSPWMVRGGLGVTGKASDRMTVSVRYDAEARSDFTNQTASVKLRWAF